METKEKYDFKKAEKVMNWIINSGETLKLHELRKEAELKAIQTIEAREEGQIIEYEEGFKIGFVKGFIEVKVEVASRMLVMNMDIELICEVTNLTMDIVEKMKKKITD